MRIPRFPALLLSLLVLPGALLTVPRSHAQATLYEGEVVVTSQSEGERTAVLSQALAQVLVKLSGDTDAPRLPAVQARLSDAHILMDQFRYRQAVERVDGLMQQRLYLIAGFDKAGVDALMAETGLPLWPSPRPELLVWLAIDDGSGARLVSSAQSSAMAPLTRSAEQRGLSLIFPLLDAEDRHDVDVSAVFNLQTDAVAVANARYAAKVQLIGRLQRRTNGWQAAWQLVDHDQVLDSWQDSESDPAQLLSAAAGRSADALASRYATPVFVGEPGQYTLAIDGLLGADDFARAVGYLRGLAIVRSAVPTASRDDVLLLSVELASSIDGLRHMVALNDVLIDAAADGSAIPALANPDAKLQPKIDARFHLNR